MMTLLQVAVGALMVFAGIAAQDSSGAFIAAVGVFMAGLASASHRGPNRG